MLSSSFCAICACDGWVRAGIAEMRRRQSDVHRDVDESMGGRASADGLSESCQDSYSSNEVEAKGEALRLIRTDRVDDEVSDDGKGRLVGEFHFICSGYEGIVRVV